MMRLFLAVDLTPELRTEVACLQGELAEAIGPVLGLRWSRPEGLHITLNFLGEVAEERLADVFAAADTVAARLQAFTIAIGGIGAFPSIGRPQVIWLGIEDGIDALASLQEQLGQALSTFGFSYDERPFKPHLTLARLNAKAPLSLLNALKVSSDLNVGVMPVAAVAVMSSRTAPGGAVYRTERAALLQFNPRHPTLAQDIED